MVNGKPKPKLNCAECNVIMIPMREWRRIPVDIRKLLLEQGFNRTASHNYCGTCYTTIRRNNAHLLRVVDKELSPDDIARLRAAIGFKPSWVAGLEDKQAYESAKKNRSEVS